MSPISYIRDAKLCGTLFGQRSADIISGVDTNFFVNHEEPLDALQQVQRDMNWPLGGLPDGFEFLLLVPNQKRRSRSRSVNAGAEC